ncbi:MAG TPA: DUF2911 domain-containing protein [Vicinamibacterales bacterium]|nr:DUF2911 domain-containing protein [Vicinamibacterales bacterium]
MKFHCRIAAVGIAAALAAPLVTAAQDLHPSRRPSPLGMARITLGDAYVRVIYGRPYKRGRDNIFGTSQSGALVPFGERWRTGANEATEITVTRDVLVAGQKLAAGTYSLFMTPGPETWTVHFNSRLGLDGPGIFADGKFTPVDLAPTDVLVVKVPATVLPADREVDQLTFEFEKTATGADMVLRWIRTEVRVPIATTT